MTGPFAVVVAVVAITVVVWVVLGVRSPRVRAVVYSVPLPITVAFLAAPDRDAGGLFMGVPLLAGFLVVAFAFQRWVGRWWGTVMGVVVWVAVAGLVHAFVHVPALVGWILGAVGLAGLTVLTRGDVHAPPAAVSGTVPVRPGWVEFAVVPVVTTVTWLAGSLLGPFVVTFPYAGVPTVLAVREHQGVFTARFVRQAWWILAFLTVTVALTPHVPVGVAVTAGWVVFLAGTVITNRGGSRPVPVRGGV